MEGPAGRGAARPFGGGGLKPVFGRGRNCFFSSHFAFFSHFHIYNFTLPYNVFFNKFRFLGGCPRWCAPGSARGPSRGLGYGGRLQYAQNRLSQVHGATILASPN